MVWGNMYTITKEFLKKMKHEMRSQYGIKEYFNELSTIELASLKGGGARKTKIRKKYKKKQTRKKCKKTQTRKRPKKKNRL